MELEFPHEKKLHLLALDVLWRRTWSLWPLWPPRTWHTECALLCISSVHIGCKIHKERIHSSPTSFSLVASLQLEMSTCPSILLITHNIPCSHDAMAWPGIFKSVDHIMQGWKLAPARKPMAGESYVGPVEILSWLVKFPIISIQIVEFGSRLWDLGVVRPVEK